MKYKMCYRFWWEGEIIELEHSTVKIEDMFFMDWCWNVTGLDPNSFELFIYPGLGLTDIYIERGYGNTYDI